MRCIFLSTLFCLEGEDSLSLGHRNRSAFGEPKKSRGSILLAHVNCGCSTSPSRESLTGGLENQALVVIGPRDMRQDQLVDGVGKFVLEVARQGFVREMPVATTHTLLQGLRVGSLSQHFDIVVRFYEHNLAALEPLLNRARDVPDIRYVRENDSSSTEPISHRLSCIVGCGEDFHDESAELQALVRFEPQPVHFAIEVPA